jgi:predicted metal-dependent hydrolase
VPARASWPVYRQQRSDRFKDRPWRRLIGVARAYSESLVPPALLPIPIRELKPAMTSSLYDPRYHQGIEHFNECDFFEAHEVWEELWQDDQSPSRRFYQGLIQVAVCLHHFGNGNTRGARKLYYSCQKYLDDYRPFHMGLNVDQLLQQLQTCCAEILNSSEDFPKVELIVDSIPEIHLEA